MKTIEELAREAGLDSCMHVNAELESLARFAALVRAQAFKDAYNAVLDMEKGDKAVRWSWFSLNRQMYLPSRRCLPSSNAEL